MPNYGYLCDTCDWADHIMRPMNERNEPLDCPVCGTDVAVRRVFEAPMVMMVALPDGTRRFEGVRQSIALERAIKSETDKTAKSKLKRELKKLTTKEAS